MSFDLTQRGQDAYIVLALGRNRINELVFRQVVVAALLVLLRVLHERLAGDLRELGLVGGPQEHLAHLLCDRRHSAGWRAARVVGGQLAARPVNGSDRDE
jgi:hypothetical protein